MKNTVQINGDVLDVVLTANVTSGGTVVAGDLVGFAQISGVTGDVVPVVLKGVFQVDKATGQAWTSGTKLYWDATAGKFTTTATANSFAGHVAQNEIAGATSGRIRLSN